MSCAALQAVLPNLVEGQDNVYGGHFMKAEAALPPSPFDMSMPQELQTASEETRAEFEQFCLKVTPCPRKCVHDWSLCPFAHCGEKARRRNPNTHTGVACVSMKQEGVCARGDACPYAHSAWEYWLHPSRYHTTLCSKGASCNRKFCFFAHHSYELRVPLVRPGAPPAIATTAAALTLDAGALPLRPQQPPTPRSEVPPLQRSCRPPWSPSESPSGSGSIEGVALGLPVGGEAAQMAARIGSLEKAAADALLAAAAAGPSVLGAPFGRGGEAGVADAQANMWPLSASPPSPPSHASTLLDLSACNLTTASTLSQAQLLPAARSAGLAFPPTSVMGQPPSQPIIAAVAGELANGSLDAATAISILSRLLPPQSFAQLLLASGVGAQQPQQPTWPMQPGSQQAGLDLAGLRAGASMW